MVAVFLCLIFFTEYNIFKNVKLLSGAQVCATPWTVVYQGPLSMGFSRQEYWSGLPSPSPGDLPNPGTEPGSPLNCGQMFCHLSHQGSPSLFPKV